MFQSDKKNVRGFFTSPWLLNPRILWHAVYTWFLTSPWLLNPRISWLIQEVLPVWISCRWRNKFSLARPLPLSSSPWVRTPSNVDLPASTFPSTASLRSINCRNWNSYLSNFIHIHVHCTCLSNSFYFTFNLCNITCCLIFSIIKTVFHS